MIDVVLTTYNYALSLKLCLEGFLNQSLSKDIYRLIIVDDGSEEDIEAIVNLFSSSLNILYSHHENKGRIYTRNKGLELATAEIIVWNEADRIPCHTFLENHLKCHRKFPNAVVTGRMKDIYFSDVAENEEKIGNIVKTDNRLARELVNSRILNNLFAEDGSSLSKIPWITASSANLSFLKKSVTDVHFDDQFSGWALDNYEFGYQLFKKRCAYVRSFEAVNYHIAHPRGVNQYSEGIKASMKYFMKKHPEPEVALFESFMLGDLSLQDYETKVSGEAIWSSTDQQLLFNKII